MRISTSQYFETSASTYQKGFSDTAKTQEQISSGTRIQTAADDPIGAAKLLQLQQQSASLTQYSTNMTTVTNAQNQEESVLNSINTAIQSARELAVQAGNGGLSDTDRTSIANQITQIQKQVFGMLNTKDSSGQYLFAGSKSSTPPYVANSDGSYSYQGDETQLSLQVSDTLSLATNDTGYAAFEQAVNVNRTASTLTAPATDDGRLSISAGQLTSQSSYNSSFTSGQPYSLSFTSATAYTVTDNFGNDITTESSGKGVYNPYATDAQSISFRGVSFAVDVNLSDADKLGADITDTALAGHTFALQTKPDTLSASRIASNTSTAQVTGATVSDSTAYSSTFPNSGAAVIKFTSATDYQVFAQPLTSASKPIAGGTMSGSSITAAGVTFNVTGTPATGDQFTVQADAHKQQNILNTLGQLSTALKAPVTDAVSSVALKNAVASAIGNIDSASKLVDTTRGLVGARGNAIDTQTTENTSMSLANKSTQSSIADTDMAAASITLTLQQTMLQASQLAFAKISQLSLFNKI